MLDPFGADPLAGPFDEDDLRRALSELRAIHRAEQSILLVHAAEYRLAAAQRRIVRFPLLAPAFRLPAVGPWRRSLFAERRFAREDGVPFSPLLRPFCTGDPSRSPSALDPKRLASGAVRDAVRLARAAVALEPWPEAHLTLARAWLAFGSPERAEDSLDALEACPGVDWNGPLARALWTAAIGVRAACAEWRGDLPGALAGFRRQLTRNPEPHSAAIVLLLASELGDRGALGVGARKLAELERGARPGLPADRECLAACIRSHRRATEGAPLSGRALPGRKRRASGGVGRSAAIGSERRPVGVRESGRWERWIRREWLHCC